MSQDQVVEFIKNLKLSEVKDLISRLEEELGVSASAPVMVGAVAGAGAAAAAAPVEEQTEFTVVLKDAGAKKIDVIKAVRELTGLGLKEAKDLVEAAPTTVKEAVPKKDVAEMKKKLEDAGATVELK